MVITIVPPSSIATRATPVTADGVPCTHKPLFRRAVRCEDDERDARGRGRRGNYYRVRPRQLNSVSGRTLDAKIKLANMIFSGVVASTT